MHIFAHNGHDHLAEITSAAAEYSVFLIVGASIVAAALVGGIFLVYLRRRK